LLPLPLQLLLLLLLLGAAEKLKEATLRSDTAP